MKSNEMFVLDVAFTRGTTRSRRRNITGRDLTRFEWKKGDAVSPRIQGVVVIGSRRDDGSTANGESEEIAKVVADLRQGDTC